MCLFWLVSTIISFTFCFQTPNKKEPQLRNQHESYSSSSVNGEGSIPKDPLYKILDELRSLKLWKEKQERKEKGKKRVEEISQDEKEKKERVLAREEHNGTREGTIEATIL